VVDKDPPSYSSAGNLARAIDLQCWDDANAACRADESRAARNHRHSGSGLNQCLAVSAEGDQMLRESSWSLQKTTVDPHNPSTLKAGDEEQ
jgi:hypothetical protein